MLTLNCNAVEVEFFRGNLYCQLTWKKKIKCLLNVSVVKNTVVLIVVDPRKREFGQRNTETVPGCKRPLAFEFLFLLFTISHFTSKVTYFYWPCLTDRFLKSFSEWPDLRNEPTTNTFLKKRNKQKKKRFLPKQTWLSTIILSPQNGRYPNHDCSLPFFGVFVILCHWEFYMEAAIF